MNKEVVGVAVAGVLVAGMLGFLVAIWPALDAKAALDEIDSFEAPDIYQFN